MRRSGVRPSSAPPKDSATYGYLISSRFSFGHIFGPPTPDVDKPLTLEINQPPDDIIQPARSRHIDQRHDVRSRVQTVVRQQVIETWRSSISLARGRMADNPSITIEILKDSQGERGVEHQSGFDESLGTFGT
jgi:hypothetical protein